METPKLTQERIKKFLEEKGKRFDGRELLDYRDVEVETGISKNAEGSARVKLGKTDVMVGVKLDVAEPYPDKEDEGTLKTTVELMPLAGEEHEPGPPGIEAIEIARIVDRSVRESGYLDMKKLCIEEGEKVYKVYLDIYVANDDGDLIDASSLGAVIALQNAKMPEYDEEEEMINHEKLTDKNLPLTDKMPITMTFHKIGDKIILDPNTAEEDASEARLSIGMTNDKEPRINALQKGNQEPLSIEQINEMIDSAFEKYKDLEKIIEKYKK